MPIAEKSASRCIVRGSVSSGERTSKTANGGRVSTCSTGWSRSIIVTSGIRTRVGATWIRSSGRAPHIPLRAMGPKPGQKSILPRRVIPLSQATLLDDPVHILSIRLIQAARVQVCLKRNKQGSGARHSRHHASVPTSIVLARDPTSSTSLIPAPPATPDTPLETPHIRASTAPPPRLPAQSARLPQSPPRTLPPRSASLRRPPRRAAPRQTHHPPSATSTSHVCPYTPA